jgi:hypothetical protein
VGSNPAAPTIHFKGLEQVCFQCFECPEAHRKQESRLWFDASRHAADVENRGLAAGRLNPLAELIKNQLGMRIDAGAGDRGVPQVLHLPLHHASSSVTLQPISLGDPEWALGFGERKDLIAPDGSGLWVGREPFKDLASIILSRFQLGVVLHLASSSAQGGINVFDGTAREGRHDLGLTRRAEPRADGTAYREGLDPARESRKRQP